MSVMAKHRPVPTLAMVIVLFMALIGGVSAITRTGTSGDDKLDGTYSADTLKGLAGDDELHGYGDTPAALRQGQRHDKRRRWQRPLVRLPRSLHPGRQRR